MFKELEKLKNDSLKQLQKVVSLADLEKLEMVIFSRQNGTFTTLAKAITEVKPEEKKAYGEAVNTAKNELTAAFAAKKSEFENAKWANLAVEEKLDVTMPQLPAKKRGHLHPVSQVQYDLEDLFTSMGFMVLDGPELESDFYNFEAVNIPADHPARDMQDTFYIKDRSDWVMRTHTSSVQVRSLEKYGAPLRAIVPGRVFRNEATDPRHEHTFGQLEGMMVGKNITIAHLKGVLETMAKHLYGPDTQVRLRPKFYPFVEPGMNGEVTCFLCHGVGCRVCKGTGWMEVFGAGMIHPNVLRAGKINPDEYTGFAFGLGLTRLVMLKYQIEDVRLLQSGSSKFLEQF